MARSFAQMGWSLQNVGRAVKEAPVRRIHGLRIGMGASSYRLHALALPITHP
ncbi:MAG TPA: hypothetical protein VMK12_28355 [Anaeromyxobacteraceae bacterium]|nr:hypothetical protein [Anaeromyxobacteraceae bacterium]